MKHFVAIAVILILVSVSVLHAQDLITLAQIRDHVHSRRISSYDRSGGPGDNLRHIENGGKRILADIKGAGIINHIWITMWPAPDKLSRNDIILRMYWDGKPYASVASPIGPFFGQGWNESYTFTSLPLAATPVEGTSLVSYFAMPFANGARIEIENQSGTEIQSFYFCVDYVEMDKLSPNTGRFHAWYNKQLMGSQDSIENEHFMFGPEGNNREGQHNYVIADIKGEGHFIGLNYYVQSPTPLWYGEGDDMIFIDGEKMPSLNGTGTEDYFNTAWGPKVLYAHPYFGYARVNNDIGTLGRTHLYRFHIADPVYFSRSLKFTIEHGHNNELTLDLASVAYWYAREATAVPPVPDAQTRKPMPLIGPYDIHRWRNEWRKSRGKDPKLWNQ
ncbi:glycoside hydrolase family 172 protein [Chitinophaga sp. 212800010-3]|uniref:glycoside hydrolase family 172 protein n=1 Tax=unclassified Chitinophaga TaxID=2619133 RepID=UPI002E1127A8